MSCKSNKWINVLIFINCLFMVLTGICYYGVAHILRTTQNQIDIYVSNNRDKFTELDIKLTEKNIDNIDRDRKILNLMSILNESIDENKDNLDFLRKEVTYFKNVDLRDVEKIKNANLLIYNITTGAGGSGTHIKINDKDYILTAAHLFDKVRNVLYAIEDKGNLAELYLVQFNKKTDLALFEVTDLINDDYLEISSKEPQEGSKVTVIGNPALLTDVFTSGIIAQIKQGYYLVDNTTYFGNSGGCLLYNGKIVGVMNQLVTFCNPPYFVSYGMAIDLKTIQEFLEGIE